MGRWKKVVAGIALVVVGIPLLFAAFLYASSWYHRWRAEQLLAVVRDLRPGVTTEAQYMQAVAQIRRHVGTDSDSEQYPRYVVVASQPNWLWMIFEQAPDSVRSWFENRSLAKGTVFSVYPTFANGILQRLDLQIFQGTEQGQIAPRAVFVTAYSGRVDRLSSYEATPFSGYSAREWGSRRSAIKVWLDDRATAEQRRRALDFCLECFTAVHPCTDPHQMLDPVMTHDLEPGR